MGNIKKSDSLVRIVVISIIICLVIWSGGLFLTHWFANTFFTSLGNESINNPALLGDSSGVVNALISAFAFAGVIVAIIMQRSELRLQREDLELQREELKNTTKELSLQREEFEIQNKTLQLQRFENTFFHMMSLQQELINNLHFTCTVFAPYEKEVSFYAEPVVREEIIDKEIEGRESFYFLYEKAILSFGNNQYRDGLKNIIYCVVKPVTDTYFSDLYCNLKEPKLLDHYFRHLFSIIAFVDTQSILEENEKGIYVNMIRNTFSPYESVWIFYNSLSNSRGLGDKALIEKYRLLSTLREELLVNRGHKYNYHPSAYLEKVRLTEDIILKWQKGKEEYRLD
ncbi:hypothetical protein M2451_000824 [Dysgonomonas sp. PFB1-18]|uniref:putative phage abortive infection protein n=1 Tax=unclassified Dysgonomonas TaxID=2630389 RepID=UPI0024735E62|nr:MULTISPECIES: putative phage abortive infection protein [unclassified Dysgonomonas]MDH6308513.1 hypothetical protein [Dysgonomonas sp. PF1-14]MDH6338014.1 hypothetical protein [Dysgonomonas sp. PF1-16]MDH6379511.1 hypothetical protein [Dysgonomonas sp. PFB1-18]MDH6396841.1 hypothetical protein [Dysgonomonas sp. PF1-23]